ncbi:Carnitinyl-CoA dehydratase [Stieleria maiorica]|uniref:Carnitinyl-CoA dehydratase n=1 Tax=Stieleria maiorica TaxID=2795974 RepID=A0A5B9MMH7_9BACT|nr:enoyl-CoA hydratase/isomerase family protein [Stieleria maiorica]QEG02602.1 Carnitinyl-CoA dehydratase [Stieleria maiorica]
MNNSTQIQLVVEEDIATLSFVPPSSKPPTLDLEVLQQLELRVEEIGRQQPRVVLLRSTSDRFFCVGANLTALKDIDEHTIAPWVLAGHNVFNQLEDLPMPVIAVVNGYAMGGGLELAMACDLIFASEEAKFAQSEASLGFIPGWGGTYRLAKRIGNSKAKFYFYGGHLLDARQAAEIGLVDLVAAPSELESDVHSYCQRVLTTNPNAIAQFKKILNDQDRTSRDENANIEASHSVSCLQDPDTKQRLHDFLAKKGRK